MCWGSRSAGSGHGIAVADDTRSKIRMQLKGKDKSRD
jgi:hypothetical protein